MAGLTEWGFNQYNRVTTGVDEQMVNTSQEFPDVGISGQKIDSLSVSKLIAGTLRVTEYIQSTGFVAGSTGWQIKGDGTAEFATGTFRGSVTGATITGGTITGATIQTAASGARVVLDSTNGIRLFNSTPTQTASMALDGSGWFGTSTGFAWDTTGAATINGQSIVTVQQQATNLFQQVTLLGSKTDGFTATASGGFSSITRYFLNTYIDIPNTTTGKAGLNTGTLGVTTGGATIGWSNGTTFTFASVGQVLGGLNSTDCAQYQGLYDDSAGTLSGTTITTRHVLFIIYNSSLYASCANGTTQTLSSAIGGVTLSNKNSYRILYTPGSSAKFYVNETLVATLSTNLPSGTTNPPNMYMMMRSTSGNGGTFLINNNYSLVWVP